MTDFVIMTDSTTDLPREFFETTGCLHEPHGFVIDGVERKDIFWTRMGKEEYFRILKSGHLITTTHADITYILRDTEEAFKNGKDVLYLCFSKYLSGTFGTLHIVKTDMAEKYPERRFVIVDTLCATMGQGILVEKAMEMKQNGCSIDEIADWAEIEKDRIYHFFTVDDLMHLKRGGRLSATSAVMGTIIGIKPILHVTDEGKLEAFEKVRGKHNALEELFKLFEKYRDCTTSKVRICHTDDEENAVILADKVKALGYTDVEVFCIGPDIAAHLGCGTVGIIFRSDK